MYIFTSIVAQKANFLSTIPSNIDLLRTFAILGVVRDIHPAITMTAIPDKPIHIDLQQVLKDKLGSKSRFIPRFMVRWLERTIYQKELNSLLAHNFPQRGADFCHGVIKELDVNVSATNEELLPTPSHRRVIIVSNHPLGGLDGMALIDYFQHRYGGKIYFLVNDMLMAVEPLRDVFLPINKHGAQSRQAIAHIDEVLAGEDPVLIFPAGLCSRRAPKGNICDLEWKKMFVVKAIQNQRDIIPVFFDGSNSDFFYNFALWRKRSGLRLNIEMIYLPREVFRSRGKNFIIRCCRPIHWQNLGRIADARATAQRIKNIVYSAADSAAYNNPNKQ